MTTEETIESQTQSVSLLEELPNYAESQRVVASMSMLDEVAAESARLAEGPDPTKWTRCRRRKFGD